IWSIQEGSLHYFQCGINFASKYFNTGMQNRNFITHIEIFQIPAVIVGVIGGGLGIIFTFFNVKANKFRRAFLVNRKWARLLEPIVIAIVYTTLTFWVSYAYGCTTFDCRYEPEDMSAKCLDERKHPDIFTEPDVDQFNCYKTNNTYN